jgi:hypothetical protein
MFIFIFLVVKDNPFLCTPYFFLKCLYYIGLLKLIEKMFYLFANLNAKLLE